MTENRPQFATASANRSLPERAVRLILLFIGLVIAHLGITLFIQSALGSDPFAVFAQGVSHLLRISIGNTYVVLFAALSAAMLAFTRGYVKSGTIVCVLFGGPIIDCFQWLLDGVVSAESPMAARLAAMVLGVVVLAMGMALVIKSDAGTGPDDLVAMILTDKLCRFQFRWVRMTCDAFFTIAGFALGGVFGIGTFAAVLLVGPVAQFFFPFYDRLVPACVRFVIPKR